MQNIPEDVEKTFKKLRLKYPFYIELAKINGGFYVYKHVYGKIPPNGESNTISEYIGKIDADGRFFKKKVLDEAGAGLNTEPASVDDIDIKILTNLSMNCRMPVPILAKRAGISTSVAYNRIAKLESLLCVRYSANINYRKLGFSKFIIMVRFLDSFPDPEQLKKVFEDKPEVQLAFLTSGEYDLVLIVYGRDAEEAKNILHDLRCTEPLDSFNSIWNLTVFNCVYGSIQTRDKFFDSVLRKKVWERTKKSRRPNKHALLHKDFAVLRELNKNGKVPFSEIDRIYGFGKGASKYTFENLVKKNILLEPVLLMKDIKAAYNGIIMLEIVNNKLFQKSRRKLLEMMLEEKYNVANRFVFAGEIGISDTLMLVLPVTAPGALESEAKQFIDNVKGVHVNKLVITKVLAGEICYRKMDNAYSLQYLSLFREYYHKVVENRTDYLMKAHNPRSI